jgi:hypothetical protein
MTGDQTHSLNMLSNRSSLDMWLEIKPSLNMLSNRSSLDMWLGIKPSLNIVIKQEQLRQVTGDQTNSLNIVIKQEQLRVKFVFETDSQEKLEVNLKEKFDCVRQHSLKLQSSSTYLSLFKMM